MALERKQLPKKDVIVSSEDISWIKENIASMSSKVQEVSTSLDKLNQTVIGNKTYGQIGLIEKVEEHNAYIEKDKEFKSKVIGGGLVLTFVWSFLLKFFKF